MWCSGEGVKRHLSGALLSPMWVPGIELSSVGKYLDPVSRLTDPRGTFNFENCFKLCPCVSVRMLASAHEYRPPTLPEVALPATVSRLAWK